MNVNRICFNCGSSSFVSDRSLGGKIVCSKCGSSSFRNKSSSFIKRKNLAILVKLYSQILCKEKLQKCDDNENLLQ